MAYRILVDRLMVTISPLTNDRGASAGLLCGSHADSLVVPRGWSVDDERLSAPRLFGVAKVETSRPSPGKRRTRVEGAVEQLELPSVERNPDPELPASVINESVEVDSAEATAGPDSPLSPLLERAFHGRPIRP